MDIVMDANILFSALITDGKTFEIIVSDTFHIFVPEFILEEFTKYKDEIMKRTKRSESEFNETIDGIKSLIAIIPKEELEKELQEARLICIDEKDIHYFALALKMKCPIWSNDKELKRQNKIKVYSTEEIIKLLM